MMRVAVRRRGQVRRAWLAFLLAASAAVLIPFALPAGAGFQADYIGGTVDSLKANAPGIVDTSNASTMVFLTKGRHIQIPYERVNLLEYGQKVDRRVAMAVVISPLFLLSKSRQHFLTIGYADEDGRQQAMLFRLGKSHVRAALVSLEARTGRKVQYQDEEARKAGKG